MYYQQPDGVSVHDGFPNPAADNSLQTLDLNQLLIKNPISTYFIRIPGGDIALVDRSLTPRPNDIVIWDNLGSLQLSVFHKINTEVQVWGVVTTRIVQYRGNNHD